MYSQTYANASFPLCLQNVDKWSFDVFALNDASGDHALKFIFYELLTRYDLISRFKVSNPAGSLLSCLDIYQKEENCKCFDYVCLINCLYVWANSLYLLVP